MCVWIMVLGPAFVAKRTYKKNSKIAETESPRCRNTASTKHSALLAPLLLLWWFLIQFLLKADAKGSSGCPPPLVVVSYSSLIEN